MHRVLEGESHFVRRPLGWLERLIYRVSGVDGRSRPGRSTRMPAGLQRRHDARHLRDPAPAARPAWNPQKLGPVEALSSFNTAASFTTNTNWQGYVARHDELLQPDGRPRWHNFISAAAGIAVAVASPAASRAADGKGPGTIATSGWT